MYVCILFVKSHNMKLNDIIVYFVLRTETSVSLYYEELFFKCLV